VKADSAHSCADRREEETIKERSNKIQTLNYYAEKIEEPRLLQSGRKYTRKDDQQLKQVTQSKLGYGKTKNPNLF
jgi:hypothetical protein